MTSSTKHVGQSTTASGLNTLAAIWLVVSPFALGFRHNMPALGNDLVLGTLIGMLAPYRFTYPGKHVWVSWINVVLGAWLVVSPWLLAFPNVHVALLNNVVTGSVVILLAAWSAFAAGSFTQPTDVR